jgi:Arc/MetJ-type ribon-helix-helix transcriptional regulator
MSRKMTVVFHDEDLYTCLKIEAARRHTAASEIIADAVREWLESREDAELLSTMEVVQTEWREKGGRPWEEVEHEVEEAISQREQAAEVKGVQA